MTNKELEEFLGIAGKKDCAAIMAKITPEKRRAYESLAVTERELKLWRAGGPKPKGVIICKDHGR